MPENSDDPPPVSDEFGEETPTKPLSIPDDVTATDAAVSGTDVPPPPRTIPAGTTPPYAGDATKERSALDDIERAQFRDLDRDGD
jgi:hypothetical protein